MLAHGHGVQMALMAAATYPERVESLVLVNGFARFSCADDYSAGLPKSAAQVLLKGIEETWGQG
jgi:pimeloyl-ACP methyl ester carboxylesterase